MRPASLRQLDPTRDSAPPPCSIQAFSRRALCAAALVLIAAGAAAQLGIRPIDYPAENPPSAEKALLGKFLFWEEQLGADSTMACATCHMPEAGGGDPRATDADSVHPGPDGLFGTADDIGGSKGVVAFDKPSAAFTWEPTFFPGHQVTGRKAPTAINAALFSSGGIDVGLFWDGRASPEFTDPQTGETAIAAHGALESQAVEPPLSALEMGGAGQSWEAIAARLASATPMALASDLPPDMAAHLAAHSGYPSMFAAAFGTPEITARRIAFAIADYERTLISDQTPFDLHFEDVQPLPPELAEGLGVFMGLCHVCHNAPRTFDGDFHNLGVRPDAEDVGLMAVTGDPEDIGRFKTAQLRNVALRPPFFHNGGMDTLEEVVDFYVAGGGFDDGHKDGILVPLQVSDAEKAALVLFLEEAMTDPRVPAALPPFDHPTLGSTAGRRNVLFGSGTPGVAGVPGVIAHVPAHVGNAQHKLGLYDAAPSAPALLLVALAPLPGAVIGGTTFNLDLSTLLLILPTNTDGHGVASVSLPVPGNPALAGLKVYADWAVADAATPAGFATTQGVEIALL
jgi:cytochrome c peroxidase